MHDIPQYEGVGFTDDEALSGVKAWLADLPPGTYAVADLVKAYSSDVAPLQITARSFGSEAVRCGLQRRRTNSVRLLVKR